MTLSSHNEQVQHYSAIKRRLLAPPPKPVVWSCITRFVLDAMTALTGKPILGLFY